VWREISVRGVLLSPIKGIIMEEKEEEITCPHCYAYIKVAGDSELYVCPVCQRSFTDEDVLLYLDSETD
jgi:Zn finger protein HypA/HybF involved in hydrogenase expression